MKKEEGIRSFLESHADIKPVSFHMPGHKGTEIYKKYGYEGFLENIMDCDITEIPGADNLFQTEGIIRETMQKYRKLYEVKKSYLLVNGSSAGLIAAILTAVPQGGKLIMARNSHKSVFNALSLGNIQPVYAQPETVEGADILGEISVEEIKRLMDENPDASAVILPSPNYYGICSDVQAISDEVHRRGKVLIIDQAHGAHLKFMHRFGGEPGKDYPAAAEDSGADMIINSIHKTLASWTQTAVLNVNSGRVDQDVLEDKLQAIESSSPSYPLMASLDINADLLINHGKELIREWEDNIEYFYSSAYQIPGLELVVDSMLDGTKLNIDMSAFGINGNELEDILNREGIFPELVTGNIVMCMTGIGNAREDYERLLKVLLSLSVSRRQVEKKAQPAILTARLEYKAVPEGFEKVKIDEAEGKICAKSIIPYPPGIPLACPGEVITSEVIEYIKERRKADEKVIGYTEDGYLFVGKE